MSRKIGLIACSSKKLGEKEPDKQFQAQYIYTGNTFGISVHQGLEKYKCDDWYILSAKHGLLERNAEICYYNLHLGKQSAKYQKQWAQNVLRSLSEKFNLQEDFFYIFGGKTYYKNLVSNLNCCVFDYICSNRINLDSPKEYRKKI